MERKKPSGGDRPKRFDWDQYERLRRNATDILQLDYEDYIETLEKDYGVKSGSEAMEKAIGLWKQVRGLF